MEDDQQFCLRWNNHQSTLISVFDTLLENQTLVDCTLAAEGKFLKAHKVVLSACSPFFATLLQQQYDKHPIFILKDVKYQELRAMMDYMYRGEVNISQDQLAALLKAAESLQIKGLSDNRSGSTPKTEQHRGLNVPGSGSSIGGGGKLSGYTLEQTQSKRPRVGPSPMETADISGSREGSSSPSRRRRKVRRRSVENAMSDIHDNSNSSQINQSSLQPQQQQQPQTNASLTGVGALAAATSSLPVSASALSTGSSGVLAATGSIVSTQGTTQQMTTNITKKTESVKGASDAMNSENIPTVGVVGTGDEQNVEHLKSEKSNHKQKSSAPGVAGKETAEMVIEPKSEYEEEGNEETVEDLTLDDEEMGMDDLDQNAGTSQAGEGSSQGYAPWQHDRSQDELLLAPQEAQQRDPQDLKYDFKTTMLMTNEMFVDNPHERFPCAVCGKSYLRKRHLQRHMRDECIGIPPRFSCELCPSRFRRKYHMVRHLTSKHGIPPAVAQQATSNSGGGASGYRSSGENNVSHTNDTCNGAVPENLSLKREPYDSENMPHSPQTATAPPQAHAANGTEVDGAVNMEAAVLDKKPIYGLTGAITAISAATVMSESNGPAVVNEAVNEEIARSLTAANADNNGAAGQIAASKALDAIGEEWKMKLGIQLISNTLLKERLINTMPFAYNNN
uniref:Longitudinals lacking protein, isoforms H/M/V n=1 Tax=Bactrocera dorsalis TaxID=27457 RepID=A0A034VU47_BACDO